MVKMSCFLESVKYYKNQWGLPRGMSSCLVVHICVFQLSHTSIASTCRHIHHFSVRRLITCCHKVIHWQMLWHFHHPQYCFHYILYRFSEGRWQAHVETNSLKHQVNPSLSFQGLLNISSLFENGLSFLKNLSLFWEGIYCSGGKYICIK